MAVISTEEVKKIAVLSRLSLTEEEIEKAAGDLANILGHFSTIQNIDTAGVPTADDASGLKNVMREDETQPQVLTTHKKLLEMAPQTHGGQIKVYAIFK